MRNASKFIRKQKYSVTAGLFISGQGFSFSCELNAQIGEQLLMDQIKGQHHSTSTKLGWAELLLRLRLGLLPSFVLGTGFITLF